MTEPTSAAERVWLERNWVPNQSSFQTWLTGSEKAHELVPRLIADVERLERERDALCEALVGLPTTCWYDHSVSPTRYEQHLSNCPRAEDAMETGHDSECEAWCRATLKSIAALIEERDAAVAALTETAATLYDAGYEAAKNERKEIKNLLWQSGREQRWE